MKKYVNMKSVSILMIASQLGMISAMAATPAATPSAEFTLVANVLALQGAGLTSTATQNAITTTVGQYLATAQKDGQQARLSQALVDLNVYTADQAANFVSSAQSAASKVESSGLSTTDATSQAMVSEIKSLSSLHPMGAAFSACDVGTGVAIAGVVTTIVGLALRFDNPTCHTDTYTTNYYGNNGYEGSSTTYGDTYCRVGNYYPHATAGDDTMIAGGIVAGIGAILMAIDRQNCNII